MAKKNLAAKFVHVDAHKRVADKRPNFSTRETTAATGKIDVRNFGKEAK